MDHEGHGHKVEGSRLALKGIVEGSAEGSLVVIDDYISFLGDIDPKSGVLRKKGFEGVDLKGKILVFKGARGSTVGPYIIYSLAKNNIAPSAMVVSKADQIVVSGCVVSSIPLGEALGFSISSLRCYNGRRASIVIKGFEAYMYIY
jgi:predicted aconitase with swiveling domain